VSISIEHMSSRCGEDGLPDVKMSLLRDSLFERGIVGILCEQIVPHRLDMGNGLGYIKIWATPPSRLVFWDGAPSSYNHHLPLLLGLTHLSVSRPSS